MKCNTCDYDDHGTGDTAHACLSGSIQVYHIGEPKPVSTDAAISLIKQGLESVRADSSQPAEPVAPINYQPCECGNAGCTGNWSGECKWGGVPSPQISDEERIETAYWEFDARRGYAQWAARPQIERDAFKAVARALLSRKEGK